MLEFLFILPLIWCAGHRKHWNDIINSTKFYPELFQNHEYNGPRIDILMKTGSRKPLSKVVPNYFYYRHIEANCPEFSTIVFQLDAIYMNKMFIAKLVNRLRGPEYLVNLFKLFLLKNIHTGFLIEPYISAWLAYPPNSDTTDIPCNLLFDVHQGVTKFILMDYKMHFLTKYSEKLIKEIFKSALVRVVSSDLHLKIVKEGIVIKEKDQEMKFLGEMEIREKWEEQLDEMIRYDSPFVVDRFNKVLDAIDLGTTGEGESHSN